MLNHAHDQIRGILDVSKRHLIYLFVLMMAGIIMPVDDLALISPGTGLFLIGLGAWGLVQVLYLLPLILRARRKRKSIAYLQGLILGALPPFLPSLLILLR